MDTRRPPRATGFECLKHIRLPAEAGTQMQARFVQVIDGASIDHPFRPQAKTAVKTQPAASLSPRAQGSERHRHDFPSDRQRSSGQVCPIPEQLRVTGPSSDEVAVGNVSMGKFGNAAADETDTKSEKAATADLRTKEDANLCIENPQFFKSREQNTMTHPCLPNVNHRPG